MSEVLSATKGIKALHEASEILFIPATILAIWSQGSVWLVSEIGVFFSLLAVCAIGILGSLGLYQVITWLNPFCKNPPLFPVLSVSFVGVGLILIFQKYLPGSIPEVSVFSGFAIMAWGFMLDVVNERATKKSEPTPI